MENKIIECIPNFSEARRPSIIEEIRNSISGVEGIRLLDTHSDFDHNRTVFTFIGSPSDIEKAAFNSIKKASELIDLNFHQGAHPRIGAADVVPFVPLRNATIKDCIDISFSLAKSVANNLNIPVYLYEESAITPDRKNLENIRRGQFEGLKTSIKTDPKRKPDFGPTEIGTAGATVIGARYPLIAYNVYLSTDNLTIAQNIARSVRYSSGGLRYVKAIGLIVDGKAQVSMNLTNYKETPVFRVLEHIRLEAMRYGVSIIESELVGMIPADALSDSAKWYLQMHNLKNEQILENQIDTLL